MSTGTVSQALFRLCASTEVSEVVMPQGAVGRSCARLMPNGFMFHRLGVIRADGTNLMSY
jgi:hypothetical protein